MIQIAIPQFREREQKQESLYKNESTGAEEA